MLLVSVGHLAEQRETWGGAGFHPLQKSKAFIKNAINWYQKKTQGRLEEEAEREAGREHMEGGPEPWTTNDGIQAGNQARREGVGKSWDGDTKCINVPPQTLLRGGGGQRL